MSLPLTTATRASLSISLSLARKSAFLAHVSSPNSATIPTNTRAITNSGSGPSVSSLSSSIFLGASLAAKKPTEADKALAAEGEAAAAEVHGYLKAVVQGKKRLLAEKKAKQEEGKEGGMI